MSQSHTRHVRITGRVQGVSYRAWARAEAARLGLSGWTRNRRDGSVEVLVSGPADAVERMVELCRDGPPAARVGAIEDLAPIEAASGPFTILNDL